MIYITFKSYLSPKNAENFTRIIYREPSGELLDEPSEVPSEKSSEDEWLLRQCSFLQHRLTTTSNKQTCLQDLLEILKLILLEIREEICATYCENTSTHGIDCYVDTYLL